MFRYLVQLGFSWAVIISKGNQGWIWGPSWRLAQIMVNLGRMDIVDHGATSGTAFPPFGFPGT